MLESPALYMEIQALQAKEVGLLQAGRYDEWLELFTPDVRYWMPVVYVEDRRDAESPRHDLGHFDDDMRTLTLRVRRAQSKRAWTEIPPSRVRYFLYPISVVARDDGRIDVESNFLVYQTRLQREENLFAGCRYDTLQRVDGDLRVASRKVVVDRAVIAAKNLTVFF